MSAAGVTADGTLGRGDRDERLHPRMTGGDYAVFAALGLLALAPLVAMLVRVWTKGGVFTGADGFLVVDPLQYLNWIRQASAGVAAGNLYDHAPGPATFVHPLVLISGLAHRAGVGLAAAYYLWIPVAVLALFAGVFRYCGRFLGRAGDRRLAMVLALFFATPVSAVIGWGAIGDQKVKFDLDFIGGELWSGTYLWGYVFTAIAVGVMPLALLAYERGRRAGARGPLVWAAVGGLLVSWLQPWQGATLALIIVVAEVVLLWRARGGVGTVLARAVPVLCAIALPLVYYFVLSRTDASWELAGTANEFARWPLWVTVAGLAPLAVPAAFAYRLPAPTFGDLGLRIWPLAGLVIFYQPAGTFPFHAFQGLALPLAVLGVLAVRRWLGERPLPMVAVVAVVAVLVVPGTLYRVDELRGAVNAGHQSFFLTPGERDALRAMEASPLPGGVLTPVEAGVLVPAYTGRETWVGTRSWTPGFGAREQQAAALFSGEMSPAQAQALVRRVGPRFLYADCHGRADITRLIAPVVDGPPRTYGCARVWQVRDRYVRDLG